LTDASYWRRLLATCHPDKDGGDAELFLFLTGLKEHVEGCAVLCSNHTGNTTQDRNSYYQDRAYGNGNGERGGYAREEQDTAARIPFADYPVEHIDLLRRALRIGQESAGGAENVLLLLRDYRQATSGRGQLSEQRGATYRQLKYLSVLADVEAREMYEVAERVPMSQAMAHWCIQTLKEGGA